MFLDLMFILVEESFIRILLILWDDNKINTFICYKSHKNMYIVHTFFNGFHQRRARSLNKIQDVKTWQCKIKMLCFKSKAASIS